jgi:hypothetical protein
VIGGGEAHGKGSEVAINFKGELAKKIASLASVNLLLLEGLNRGKFPLYVWFFTRRT